MLLFLFVDQALTLIKEHKQRQFEQVRSRQLELALDRAQRPSPVTTIKLKHASCIEMVLTDTISHCNGAGDYVEICMLDGRKVLHSGSLNELDDLLPPTFLRVHRSHIVNMDTIKSLRRIESGVGVLELANGASIPVSRRIMPKVRNALG